MLREQILARMQSTCEVDDNGVTTQVPFESFPVANQSSSLSCGQEVEQNVTDEDEDTELVPFTRRIKNTPVVYATSS